MPIHFVYICIIYKHLEGVELPSTVHTNHQNFFKKIIKAEKFFNTVMVCMLQKPSRKTQTTFTALDFVINNADMFEDRRCELEIAVNMLSTQH
jgi:hypothetical protein